LDQPTPYTAKVGQNFGASLDRIVIASELCQSLKFSHYLAAAADFSSSWMISGTAEYALGGSLTIP